MAQVLNALSPEPNAVAPRSRYSPHEGPSTSRRKFEPLWGLCQATRGLPFTVQRNGFAIVALK